MFTGKATLGSEFPCYLLPFPLHNVLCLLRPGVQYHATTPLSFGNHENAIAG